MEDPIVDSEILHGGEGGDVERWLEPRNKFIVIVIACLLIFISLYCLHLCCYSLAYSTLCLLCIHHCITLITHFYQSILISTRRQL